MNGITLLDRSVVLQPEGTLRDEVVIATKFGWNIDPDTGERRAGLNNKPGHVRRAVDGMLKRLKERESFTAWRRTWLRLISISRPTTYVRLRRQLPALNGDEKAECCFAFRISY